METVPATPFFLSGKAGRIFALYYPPAKDVRCRGAFLHAPAFAEEMNKSRHMVAQQAKMLAANGYAVLVPDYYGTGDSEGDFKEGQWDIWRTDLITCAEWLLEQSGVAVISLWGLRFGCLLIQDLINKSDLTIDNLLMWQPITNGKQMISQFLRLRLAAGLIGSGEKETVAMLREKSHKGDCLEIAGYDLAPELLVNIEDASLSQDPPTLYGDIFWFEICGKKVKSLTPASMRIINSWHQGKCKVTADAVIGAPFWTTQEISSSPKLIERTTSLFS